MPNKMTAKSVWWERLRSFMKTHKGLYVIIVAALLLELTTAGIYYTAQDIIQNSVDRLVEREMQSIYRRIGGMLSKEVAPLDNMTWVVRENLNKPDSMYAIAREFVGHSATLAGAGMAFVPNYYREKGYWFEPYAVRQPDSTITTMQLGSSEHDYTQSEFFKVPMEKGSGHWSAPYMDSDGAKTIVTTYSVPVRDSGGRIVAIVAADFTMQWIDSIMNGKKMYEKTHRYLLTGNHKLVAGEDGPLLRKIVKHIKSSNTLEGFISIPDAIGDDLQVFVHPVGGGTDWVLVNVASYDEVFGKLRRVRVMLLLLALAGLLIAGFIVYRSSRSLERLREVNAEKERIDGELRVASQIQQSMLPNQNLFMDEVDILGSLVPAREVGGDLFDYYVRDEKLLFCIGDVSGKGAPSAMLMGVIHALFRAFSAHENNPARIMQTINESSCRGNESNMFVTMFIGVLDLPTGRLRYCDAGHDAPIILREKRKEKGETSMAAEENITSLPVLPHLPVGVFEETSYKVQEAYLEPGSTLFLYTDGLTEAKRAPKQLFGLERVKEVLEQCAERHLAPRAILETVGEKVDEFVGDAMQSDDLTMLAIHYTPRRFESTFMETLVLTNDIHEVTKLSAFQKDVYAKMGLDKSLARQLRLAVEEAVVNVIDYAYPIGSEGYIEVRMMSDGRSLKIVITDSGVAFDPTAKERTDTTLSAEERQIGGLGILLVRELMDSINYERTNGRNILTLVKRIHKA